MPHKAIILGRRWKPVLFLSLVVAGSMLGWSSLSSAPPQPGGPVGVFMRAKLEHSQKALEGLALNKPEQIAKNAKELVALSNAAEWQVFDTEDYLQHSKDFRRSAVALEKAAQERNLDGAALAYMEMTMKCVSCHKYVRGVRMARVDGRRDAVVAGAAWSLRELN